MTVPQSTPAAGVASAPATTSTPATTSHTGRSEVGVAILGMGVVGSDVVRLLRDNTEAFEHRIGAPVVIRGIAVRDVTKDRGVDPALLTSDPQGLVDRDDVDVVVEVMGDVDGVLEVLKSALRQGKSVVTANKAIVAAHTSELWEAADETEVDLYFEAAVAGAIPVLGPLRRSLAGDQVERIIGIVNGTTNYILSSMDATGASYEDALAEAGRLGYAESDPTADVDGYDAASKAAILASLAFHTRVTAADVHREGIRSITADDLTSAHSLGCTVKLIAMCERLRKEDGSEAVSARVYPALIPLDHPLASVNGAYNAVFVEAEAAGRLMFYGPGAGGAPTASAVLGDLVAAARNVVHGGRAPGESAYADLPVAPFGDVVTRYLVDMDVADEVGVLSTIARDFARHTVSISAVRQQVGSGDWNGKELSESPEGVMGEGDGGPAHRESADSTAAGLRGTGARLLVATHAAREADLADTVDVLEASEHVLRINSVLRMEGVDDQ